MVGFRRPAAILLPLLAVFGSSLAEEATTAATPASEAAASAVHVLTEKSFESFLKEHPHALVKFYAPWCGHCKRLAPDYEKAAEELQDSGIVLAKVDATVEEELARAHEIRGFPTLKFFRNGVAEEYRGGRSAANIVEWLRTMTGPAVTTIEDEEAAKKYLEGEPAAKVIFMGSFKDAESPAYKLFESVADSSRQQGKFMSRIHPSAEEEKVTVFRANEAVDAELVLTSQTTKEELEALIAAESLPYFGPINSDNYADYFSAEKDMVWFAGEEKDFEDQADEIRAAAKNFRTDYSFVWLDTEKFSDHASQSLGVSNFPALVFTTKDGRYVFPEPADGAFKSAAIVAFLNDVREGKIERSLMSEPIPETNNEPVKVVVGKSFTDLVLRDDKDVLLEVYAPWCGHCKKFEPVYEEFAERMQNNAHLVVAKMDGTVNEVPVANFEWRGFPTIFFVPAGQQKPVVFDGPRTAEGLTDFVKEHGTKPLETEVESTRDEL